MEEIKTDKKSLKKFGEKSAIGFLIIGAILFLLRKELYIYSLIAAGFFELLALTFPKALKYISIASFKIAEPISWVASRIIFSIFFFLIVTPIGIIMRLTGKDPLSRKIEKEANTYWLLKEEKEYDQKHFEKNVLIRLDITEKHCPPKF